MRHEFSHEYDYTSVPAEVPPPETEALPVSPPPVAAPRGVGCLPSVALMLGVLAAWALLGAIASIGDGDILLAFADFMKMLLLSVVAYGLWHRYRWAANMMLIVCLMLAGEFIGPSVLLTVESTSRYLTSPVAQIMMLGVLAGMVLVIGAVFIVIGGWFWLRRRSFSPHPRVEAWGTGVYFIAFTIAMLVIVADIATVYWSLDELVETQAEDFRRLDEMTRDAW